MRAKELAEQLLKYPDYDVYLEVCVNYTTYDQPWPEYDTFKVVGVSDVGHNSKEIMLEVDVI